MHEKKRRKPVCFLLFLLWGVQILSAQYQVTGGEKAPLLAVNNTAHRIQVYLVYKANQATISYTSESGKHQWYRYQTKIANHEPVASTQNGNTSQVSNPAEGYGYFVLEGENYSMSKTVWIIDYSNYPAQIKNIGLSHEVDPCTEFRLTGTNESTPLYYQRPDGAKTRLERIFEVSYWTLGWIKTEKKFSAPIYEIRTLKETELFNTQDTVPLTDTEVKVAGDLFARHFGTEQTLSAGFYQAAAIKVYPNMEVLSSGETNLNTSDTSAWLPPVEVRFSAIANTPVATHFKWKIFRGNETLPIVDMADQVIEYTFKETGKYVVKLEVSNQTGTCTNDEHTFELQLTDSYLFVPNVFSPEGSPGVNDQFKVAYRSITHFKAWVFNRWGSVLYHWTDPSKGWDGKYRGKYVPAGAYYYVIEYRDSNGKAQKKAGDINVVRSSKSTEIIDK